MALRRIVAPTVNPLTLLVVKQHLRVIHNAEDDLILLAMESALSAIDGKDGVLGRCLMPQTWELVYDCFQVGPIKIPLPPLQSIVSIKYFDFAGQLQTLAANQYLVDPYSSPGWVSPVTDWPVTYDTINAVRITFIAGYADATEVPAPLKNAMLLHIGDLFENRETGVIGVTHANNPAYDDLIFPYRMLSP